MFVPIPILILVALVFIVLLTMRRLRAWQRPDPSLDTPQPHDPLRGVSTAGFRDLSAARARSVDMSAPNRTLPVLAPEVEQKVRAMIAAGRRVEAIKIAHEATRVSLRDAKELVDTLAIS